MDEAAAAPDLTGEWRGRWASSVSGRSGPLRGTFHKLDPAQYRVRFRGRFWVVFPFWYKAALVIAGTESDKVLLAGAKWLPFFGEFTYEAEATVREFLARYRTKKDHGTFTMSRVAH